MAKAKLCSFTLSLMGGACFPVFAQPAGQAAAPPQAAASAVTPTTLQSITVTGRRARGNSDEAIKGYKADGTSALGFELELQQAPASISILSADFLKDAGAKKLGDALNFLPGVGIGDNSGSTREGVLIRGYSASPTVNGIPQAITTRPKYSFINIERVEVIKGIAGVEGNVDDFGGTIDLVTKKPQRQTARAFSFGLGDYGYKSLSTDVTGPVTADGNVQYRLIGAMTQPEIWRPGRPTHNPRAELFPSLNWDYASGSNVLIELGITRYNDPLDRGGLYIEGAGFPGNFTPRHWSIHQRGDQQTLDFRQVDLTWNHRFNADWAFKLNAQRTSTGELATGFRNGSTEGAFLYAADGITWNGTGLQIPIYPDDAMNRFGSSGITAELRARLQTGKVRHALRAALATSSGNDSFGYGGVNVPQSFTPVVSNTINLFAPNNNQTPNITGADGPFYAYFNRGTKKRSMSAQWLAEWTPRLRTLFGWRSETTDTFARDEGGDPATLGAPYATEARGLKSLALRLGVSYDLQEDLSVFATIGSGSFAQSATARDNSSINAPRDVRNIEAGVKRTLAGGKALASAALYQLREKNLLTADCLPSEINCQFQKLVGGRQIRGVELELRGEIARDLQVGGGVGLQQATILESPSGFAGNRFSNTPRVQVSAFTNYRWAALGLEPLKSNLGVVHVGNRFGNSGNTIVLPAYTLVNLGASWEFNKQTTLSFNVNNLLDKTHYTSMQDGDSAASDQVSVGDRRLMQLTLDVRF